MSKKLSLSLTSIDDIKNQNKQNIHNSIPKTEEELNKDVEFKNINNFAQLRKKVFDLTKIQKQTDSEININKQKIDLIVQNKIKDFPNIISAENNILYERANFNQNKKLIEDNRKYFEEKLSEMDKKIKTFFGSSESTTDIPQIKNGTKDFNLKNNTTDDITNTLNSNNIKTQKKIFNFNEMKKSLSNLNQSKMDKNEIDNRIAKISKYIDDVNQRLTDLITGLFGTEEEIITEILEKKRPVGFVTLNDFEKYKANTKNDLNNTKIDCKNLKLLIDKLQDDLIKKSNYSDLDNLKSYFLQKIDELLSNISKKYAEKLETNISIKSLENQIKKILYTLANRPENDGCSGDNWLLAKKPLTNFSCAACESVIGELSDTKNKFIAWNKMPIRESGDKIYRLGNGYSRILQMVNVDNTGNISLNPGNNQDYSTFYDNNNNSIINTSRGKHRVKSANHDKDNEKSVELSNNNRSKIICDKRNERKLPRIKCSMSSEALDKFIENNNSSKRNNVNIVNNVTNNNIALSPKITKIIKKTQSKFVI